MDTTGLAAVFTGHREPFELRELPVPEPEPGAIVIRIGMACICGTDLHMWRGDVPEHTFMPPGGRIIGHEMTGTVFRLGAGVTADSLGRPLREGDRVAYTYFYPCRSCYACLRGQFAACPNKRRPAVPPDTFPAFCGAFAEYFYLQPGHFVFRVPDDLPDELVAPANCALSQVIHGLRRGGLALGETIVVQGAGGLGVQAVAVARSTGAERIIVIDGVPERLELARRFGADQTISLADYPTPEARVDRVKTLTDGFGADLALEVVGLPAVIPEGIAMLRAGGRYVEIGCVAQGQEVNFDPSALVYGSKSILGVIMYDPLVLPAALQFLRRNQHTYPFHELISHRYPLREIDRAFQDADWEAGSGVGVTRACLVPG
ncbi:MAG: zinc-binding dehydrogenase [Chloroflexota bacterium]